MTSLFDCETGPLPDEQLAKVKPEFKPARNLKDPDKIQADIAQKELDWRESAALDATTAQVLVIGISSKKQDFGLLDNTNGEKALLESFWAWLSEELLFSNGKAAGFNVFGFDLPMLWRRSIILGVTPMAGLRVGRYWHREITDLMEVWTCGNREQRISLDMLARTLGIGAKNGNGKDFADLWASDKAKAIEYVLQDMALTRAVATRFGL